MATEEMSVRLRQVLRALERSALVLERSEVGCCGVTLSQCHLLQEVFSRGDGVSLTEAALALGLDLSTVSRVADGLVRQGLLKRKTDAVDRRRLVLSMTVRGRKLVESIDKSMTGFYRRLLECIPPDRREAVIENLDVLVVAYKQTKGEYCRE